MRKNYKYKNIPCPKCGGRGYITVTEEFNNWHGSYARPCDQCNGTGRVSDIMTNLEYLRSMDEMELVEFLEYHTVDSWRAPGEGWDEWLRKPAGDWRND